MYKVVYKRSTITHSKRLKTAKMWIVGTGEKHKTFLSFHHIVLYTELSIQRAANSELGNDSGHSFVWTLAPECKQWALSAFILLDTAEGFILHYEGTVQHLRTHVPTGELNPLDQQHHTTTIWKTHCVCVCVCVRAHMCVCVYYRFARKVLYLDEGVEMEAVLQSKQNEQCYLCVSIYVEFPHWAFFKIPAHWPIHLSLTLSASWCISQRGKKAWYSI